MLHVLEAVAAGAARHVVDVVRHTPGFRHEVALPRHRKGWTTDEYVAGALGEAGADIHFVDMRRMPVHPRNATAIAALRRLIAGRRPAVVHGHSSVGGALARVAAWSAPVGRVYTPHALNPARAAIAVERLLARRTDCLVALSESERLLVADLALLPPERVALIPNGIDLEVPSGPVVDLRDRLGLPRQAPVVGCVARVAAQKAPDAFVRVCALVTRAHPEVHFVLIGSGPLDAEVDRVVADEGVEQNFHRIKDMPDAWRIMDQLDVFTLTSRYEGLPYAPLEAMRARTAVVLTDVAGNREVAADGGGVLVGAGDAPSMAAAVVDLLQDPARRAAQAARGRARVEAHFRVESMGAKLATLYDRVSRRQVNQA